MDLLSLDDDDGLQKKGRVDGSGDKVELVEPGMILLDCCREG